MVRTRTSEDSILDIPEGSVERGHGQVPRGGAPPRPLVSLEQLLATQNDLMRRLVENAERRGAEHQQPGIKRGILRTQIFWQLTCQSLPMRPTPWWQTTGSTPRSLSLGYFTVQSTRRLYTQRNSSEAQLEPRGFPTLPPYLLITMFHGATFVLPSAHITYLWDCSALS
jgi:hypothetical protein